MATKKGKSRKRYTKEKRAEILAAASKERLTATDVQKRFGVVPVTYYSWRRQAGVGRSDVIRDPLGSAPSSTSVRTRVRSQLERMLPKIVDEEIDRFVRSMFGSVRASSRR